MQKPFRSHACLGGVLICIGVLFSGCSPFLTRHSPCPRPDEKDPRIGSRIKDSCRRTDLSHDCLTVTQPKPFIPLRLTPEFVSFQKEDASLTQIVG
jgi:hypothetical protein